MVSYPTDNPDPSIYDVPHHSEYDCRACGRTITTGELCGECAKGNDPFFTCDNVGRDLKR